MKSMALILQYILPHRLVSRLMYYLMRIKFKPVKNYTLKFMIKSFDINLAEAASSNFDDYPHFNAFFTRALKDGCRPIDNMRDSIVSPVDGAVSQVGTIKKGQMFQAKGHEFSCKELLATEFDDDFINGQFITIYLSPKDYHRLHAPMTCDLKNMRHIPGRLFSVADWTTQKIPKLFARNERLVNILHTEIGKVAYVYVGAILVSSIETISNGVITPPYAKTITDLIPQGQSHYLKGAEMGRFNMGSTIILLFPENNMAFEEHIQAGTSLKMGERIGTMLSFK